MLDFNFTVDVEITNRCNAKCDFCPRDATPHQGLMSVETFEHSLARTLEFRETIQNMDPNLVSVRMGELVGIFNMNALKMSFCGLGEPLLNKHAADWIRQARDEGIDCTMSSNAALLDERRAEALLDAGLQQMMINAGDLDEEYEEVYGLPFEKTRDNVVRFARMAEGRCEVGIALVDHHRDPAHVAVMKQYWEDRGVSWFFTFDVMNRGGALFVEHMQYASYPEHQVAATWWHDNGGDAYCILPFIGANIGYDGNYYLCCSDWKKEASLGHVSDTSMIDILAGKFEYLRSREPVCKTCNHDPINRMTEGLRAVSEGELRESTGQELSDEMVELGANFNRALEQLNPGVTDSGRDLVGSSQTERRLIPVTAL
jgi:MoaA/NifB/PqqE/SkfB family radical SAM enzyme